MTAALITSVFSIKRGWRSYKFVAFPADYVLGRPVVRYLASGNALLRPAAIGNFKSASPPA